MASVNAVERPALAQRAEASVAPERIWNQWNGSDPVVMSLKVALSSAIEGVRI